MRISLYIVRCCWGGMEGTRDDENGTRLTSSHPQWSLSEMWEQRLHSAQSQGVRVVVSFLRAILLLACLLVPHLPVLQDCNIVRLTLKFD